MDPFQLVLLLATIATVRNAFLNSLQGTVSYSQAAGCEDIMISQHGNVLVCAKFFVKVVEIYQNTGTGFQLQQTIGLVNSPHDLGMTDDAQSIYVTTTT